MSLIDALILALYIYVFFYCISNFYLIIKSKGKFSIECYCTKYRNINEAASILIFISSVTVIFSQIAIPAGDENSWTAAVIANGVATMFVCRGIRLKEEERAHHHKCII